MVRFEFVAATKQGSKARVALIGGPGSGKTFSALTIAQGLDGGAATIGVIDTERESARKYADMFEFRWVGMNAFNPDDLTLATLEAAQQGIDVLIVDTWSPFWGGEDGMLDRVGGFASSFEGWRQMRPVERRMVNALLGYPGHVIVNMRTKTEYVVERNDNGKMEPKRVGTKPEQRDGVEYEFDVVCDLDNAGALMRVSKSRCPELAGQVFAHPSAQVGEAIQAWLDRDAVGEPFNPRTVREWALTQQSLEQLRAKYVELAQRGQIDAVVHNLHEDKPITLGQLLNDRAAVLKQQAARAGRQQQQRREPVGDHGVGYGDSGDGDAGDAGAPQAVVAG